MTIEKVIDQEQAEVKTRWKNEIKNSCKKTVPPASYG